MLSRVLNGKSLADVYQLGMSMQDSAAIAGLTIINPALGKMGTMLLGGASATQTMLDAVERGASDEQAIGLGLLSGAFEIFFEKYELDELLDNVKYAVKGAGKGALVKTMARQALSEGVGEGATEIANILADCAVMAEKSNWQMNIEKYITEKNMTPKEAKKQAFIDAALQVGEAVAGGLISGLVSSGAYTGVQTLTKNAGYTKTGATIMDADGGVEALMNLANQIAGVSSEDVRNTLTSQIDKVSQKPTARNVGQLNATVQAANTQANATANQASAVGKPDNTATNRANTIINQADVAKSLRNKGVYSRKVDSLAEVIAARLNGQELTRSQRSFLSFELGRPAVQSVISEFIHNSKATTEQYSQDIRQNMLPDQELSNPENLQRDQISQQRYNEFSEATNLSELHKHREKSRGAWMHGKKAENVIKERNAASAMEFFGAESKDDLKSIIQRSTIKLKNGFSCFPEGDVLNTNIKEVAELDGFFDVGMHGTSTAVGFGSEKTNMSARTLAAIIYHSKGYNGQKIRLLSCSTGRIVGDEYCFAEELANALGVEVIAPDDILYISSKGNLQVGDAGNGKFVTFKPNQRRRIK